MGANLSLAAESAIPVPPWLDTQTANLVRAITVRVSQRHPDLRAVILFGSIARHDERPLGDQEPSDVDLLLIFDLPPGANRLPYAQSLAIYESVGMARDRYLHTPREVQVLLATGELTDWDPTFVANVARDRIILWSQGPLPASLTTP
ncbi:MAG TPA: nucleotidyltransferase domain-containing protein [Ktedonobacterales bacterium]|jgi:predicted nucleotidyltransferase